MCKLFASPEQRLRDVTVKGDMIITDTNRDSTLNPITPRGTMVDLVHSYHDPVEDEARCVARHLVARLRLIILAPNQFTPIPFQVKALKLLLKDVQTTGPKGSSKAKGNAVDVEEDDGVRVSL